MGGFLHRHPAAVRMEVHRMGPALEHRQVPLRTALVEAQNVQIAVVAFDLEVAIVWSIPLIDGFDDFDLARIQPKAHRHFDPEMAGAALDLYLHGCPLPGPSIVGALPPEEVGWCAPPGSALRLPIGLSSLVLVLMPSGGLENDLIDRCSRDRPRWHARSWMITYYACAGGSSRAAGGFAMPSSMA